VGRGPSHCYRGAILARASFRRARLGHAAVTIGIAEAPKPAQDKIMSQMKERLVTGAFKHENGCLFTMQAGLYGTEYRHRPTSSS